MHHFLGLAAVSFMLTGCVTSTDKYTAVKLENESLRSQLGESESKARASQAQAQAYQNQLQSLVDGAGSKDGLLKNYSEQLALAQAQVAELNAKYQEALGKVGSQIALPAVVTSALDDFAKQNPDLVDFDAARGIVKFKTDFTFATGSDQATEKAKAAIGRFAQILNSDAAKGYELMVAGHTDNTPVNNPATKQRHPDNWYLSSHRAISVGQELVKHQINSQRVAVVGYADQRPIAPNTTTDGKAQNRRVEVLILPSTVRSTVASGSAMKSNSKSPRPAASLNKDSIAAPAAGPILNK
jgi:chemotaxis protein MotB